MDFKSLVKQYQSIEEDSSKMAESKDMLLACFKNTFPQQTKISFNIYHTLVPVGISLLALLFIFISGTGLALWAKNTLPGNFLYPVKLGFEEARMIAIFDTSKEAVLRAEILTNRLFEAKTLAQRAEKGEQGLEQDMQYVAQSFTNELKKLKKQIAANVAQQPKPEIVPFSEEELLATDQLSIISDSPDLPIADLLQIFTVVQSDKLEVLLAETKELLAKKDLVTALLRIEEAEKLTDVSTDVSAEAPSGAEEEGTPIQEEQLNDQLPIINPISDPNGSSDNQSSITDQPGSLGTIGQELDIDFSIDTQKEETVSTGMSRE